MHLEQEIQAQLKLISRGVVEIIPEDELRAKLRRSLQTNQPLKIKLGLDPTAPDIHLGHTVVLHKLRQFQQLGHQIIIIIGDFTGMIGDPTGKSETRKQLSAAAVQTNAQTYKEQIFRILDPHQTQLVFNSQWLAPMQFADVIQLAAQITVARMLERDDFAKRYSESQPISVHEFFYPLMQGYDSVYLHADVEVGGTDQKFNLLMGRMLQRAVGQEPQVALMLPILEGLDGVQKMSKSLGNYIGINEPPQTIYGKVMSVNDTLMFRYYELVTQVPQEEIERLRIGMEQGVNHPRDLKMQLAWEIVKQYHGSEAADSAQAEFRRVFQKGELPDKINEVILDPAQVAGKKVWMPHLLVATGLCATSSEALRSIKGRAVRYNEERWLDPDEHVTVTDGMILQVGKRKSVRIKLQDK